MLVFTIINKRDKFYKLGILCGILNQEYLKMRVKKMNIFKDIQKLEFVVETYFSDLQKFNISFFALT